MEYLTSAIKKDCCIAANKKSIVFQTNVDKFIKH